MFSSQIVACDLFLEMPLTSQALYFHLGMSADDDGFVSPKKILRMTGAAEDDLKMLMFKGFAIQCESGVIVITHWKQNNYLRNDRYTPTIYGAEKAKLACVQGVYRLDTAGIPAVNQRETQYRKEGSKEGRRVFSSKKKKGATDDLHVDTAIAQTRRALEEKGILAPRT